MTDTVWDVTSELDETVVEAQYRAALDALKQARRAGKLMLKESEVVEAVRTASGDELADVVRDNITTLRVIFKAWLTQR